MLKIKEKENNNENKLSFKNDFNRLLELSNRDYLAEKSYEFLLNLYDQNKFSKHKIFTVFFWNRFSGEVKRSYSTYKSKQLEDIPHNSRDFISWIPFFSTNLEEFFTSASVTKVLDPQKSFVTVDIIKENKSDLIDLIKKKIQKKLARDQKEMLSAVSSNNWNFFLNKSSRGELYPVDVYPEQLQYKLFWSNTEIFNDASNCYSIISSVFNVKGKYYSLRITNLVAKFEDDGKVILKEPYNKAIDLLLRFAISAIENPDKHSAHREEKLFMFIQSLEENSLHKGFNKFQSLENNLNLYISKLNSYLFKNYNAPKLFPKDFEALIGLQFNSEERKVAVKIMLDKVLNFLKENASKPTFYNEILKAPLYKIFVEDSVEKDFHIVESFKNSIKLKEAIQTSDRTILYSPISVQFGTIEQFFQKDDELIQEINKIEELIKLNDVKTTRSVKSEIELILKSKFADFRPIFKKHLEFVLLFMKTID